MVASDTMSTSSTRPMYVITVTFDIGARALEEPWKDVLGLLSRHHRRRRYTEPLNGSLSVPWVSLVVIDPDRQGVLLAATIIMLSSSHQPIIFEITSPVMKYSKYVLRLSCMMSSLSWS